MAYKTALHILDPTEDVDKSNWFKTGHFRKPKGSASEESQMKRQRSTVDDNGDFVLVECSDSEYSEGSSEDGYSGEWEHRSNNEASREDESENEDEVEYQSGTEIPLLGLRLASPC